MCVYAHVCACMRASNVNLLSTISSKASNCKIKLTTIIDSFHFFASSPGDGAIIEHLLQELSVSFKVLLHFVRHLLVVL